MSDPAPGHRPWWESDDYVLRPRGESIPSIPRPPEPLPAEPVPHLIPCRSCDKRVEEGTAVCPYCRARLRDAPARREGRERERQPDRAPADASALIAVVWFFVGLLGVSLVQGWVLRGMVEKGEPNPRDLLRLIGIVEVIDTALVLLAVCVVVRPRRYPSPPPEQQAAAWALALPILVGLLSINLLYHLVIQRLLGLPRITEDMTFGLGLWSPVVWLMTCLQPGIVEELFFRHLALGTLRRYVGMHSAVLVSSVMFGMAHVGVPLSVPLLVVLGMGFGYVRIWSGSLVLPMLMHFLHNLAVLFLEAHL
jgi:membrane protease YdiL (CAAX protease family)